jgi:hypothetical protein
MPLSECAVLIWLTMSGIVICYQIVLCREIAGARQTLFDLSERVTRMEERCNHFQTRN